MNAGTSSAVVGGRRVASDRELLDLCRDWQDRHFEFYGDWPRESLARSLSFKAYGELSILLRFRLRRSPATVRDSIVGHWLQLAGSIESGLTVFGPRIGPEYFLPVLRLLKDLGELAPENEARWRESIRFHYDWIAPRSHSDRYAVLNGWRNLGWKDLPGPGYGEPIPGVLAALPPPDRMSFASAYELTHLVFYECDFGMAELPGEWIERAKEWKRTIDGLIVRAIADDFVDLMLELALVGRMLSCLDENLYGCVLDIARWQIQEYGAVREWRNRHAARYRDTDRRRYHWAVSYHSMLLLEMLLELSPGVPRERSPQDDRSAARMCEVAEIGGALEALHRGDVDLADRLLARSRRGGSTELYSSLIGEAESRSMILRELQEGVPSSEQGIELKTEAKRVAVREVEPDDLRPILEMQNCSDFLRYTNMYERTEEQVSRLLRKMIACNCAEDWQGCYRTVLDREGGEAIGLVMASRTGVRSAELGVEIDSRYWGRGLATEAAAWMLGHCFGPLSLHRVEAWCCRDNIGAYRSLQKLGMREEGCLRGNRLVRGKWTDSVIFGILDSEWSSSGRETK